jgi:hypothetical protein
MPALDWPPPAIFALDDASPRIGRLAIDDLAVTRSVFLLHAGELQVARTEKNIIVRYLDGFRQLERAGFVGDEQRINWLDGLRLANQQADLFGVDYQIGAQSPYAYAAEFSPGPIMLNQSVMQVRFRLLHEGDLDRFLDSLARQGAGIFTVDQCLMRRIDTRGVIRYQPNVNAECSLSWITVRVGASAEQKKP